MGVIAKKKDKKMHIPTKFWRRMNEIQQEVTVSTGDNVLLALTLFIIGIGITLIITGLSKLTPVWFLVVLISFMFIWFILQNFILLLDSIFFKEKRFTNKSKFISFVLSFFMFLVLLIGLPSLLAQIFQKSYNIYFRSGTIGFYILALVVYTAPVIIGIKIYPKIKRFFKYNCPTLILKGILSTKREHREKLLKHWDTTISELKELDKKY